MAITADSVPTGPGHQARPVLTAATTAEEALAAAGPQRLWALSDGEVADAMEAMGRVHAQAQAHLVAVLAEAKSRGLGSGDGWGPRDWAMMRAPGLSARTLGQLDVVAGAVGEPRLRQVCEAVAAAGSGVAAQVEDALELGRAAMLVRFHEQVRGMADPGHLEEVTSLLLGAARGADATSERELTVMVRRTADMMRPDRLVEHDADVRRAHRSLVKGKGPMGMWRYTMLLDDEGAAIVDAAVDALAKPVPDADTGEPDLRTPAARRADALLEVVTRAVSAPDGVPRQAKTSLVVTMGLEQLQQRCRGAGMTLSGHMLTIETVRRLACDAQVIPAVLGTHGEILEHGRAERLFTRAQIRHLWLRDRGCTYPGCTRPPMWAEAHHLIHWADGGPTDVDFAALLCQRHHSVVHSNRYAGQVLDGPRGKQVHWDLTPGSYHEQLALWSACGSAPSDPPRP